MNVFSSMSNFAHFLSVNQSTLYIHSSNKSWKAYGAKPKKKKEENQNYYNIIIIVQQLFFYILKHYK